MTDIDLGKVKRNVATMVQKGAPESDIDGYISQSGTTLDAVKNFKAAPPAPKEAPEPQYTGIHGAIQKLGSMWPESVSPADIALIPAALGGEAGLAKGLDMAGNLITREAPRIAQTMGESALARGGAMLGKGAVGGAAGNAALQGTLAKPGERLQAAQEGLVPGAVYGAGIGGALGAGKKLLPHIPQSVRDLLKDESTEIKYKEPETPIMSQEEHGNLARASYQKANTTGGAVKQEVSDNFFDNAINTISTDKKIIESERARPYVQELEKFGLFKGEPLTLERAQYIDERLSDMANGFYKAKGLEKEGQKILEIQGKFRSMLHDASDGDLIGGKAGFKAWREGQQHWSDMMKQRTLEDMITRANYTQNAAQSMRSQAAALLKNKSAMRAFSSPEEKAAVKRIAQGGGVDELLSLPSSRLIAIGEAAGGHLGGAAAAKAASMASHGVRNAYRVNKVNDLSRIITKNAQKRIAESKKIPEPMKLLTGPETIYQSGKAGTVPTTAQQMKSGRFQSEFDKANQQIAQQKLAKAPSNVQGITPEMIQAAQEKLALQGHQPSEFGNLLSQIFGGQQP